MLSRYLAVLQVSSRLELPEAGGQGTAGAALSSPAGAGDSAHLASRVDGNVGEGEEDVALAPSGLRMVWKGRYRFQKYLGTVHGFKPCT